MKDRIFKLSQNEDGYALEAKESVNDGLEREMVAFANGKGGKIFLRVIDDNNVKSAEVTDSLKEEIEMIAFNCSPPIIITYEEYKNVLIINIQEGDKKPYKCKSGFYMYSSEEESKSLISSFFEKVIHKAKFNYLYEATEKKSFAKSEKSVAEKTRKAKVLTISKDDEIDGDITPLYEPTKRRQRMELIFIHKTEKPTMAKMKTKFKVSLATVKRDVASLKSEGLIEFIGADKTGKYVLTIKGKELMADPKKGKKIRLQ
jgi:predicted HTH transcriptional regulator